MVEIIRIGIDKAIGSVMVIEVIALYRARGIVDSESHAGPPSIGSYVASELTAKLIVILPVITVLNRLTLLQIRH
jgi:hypothetical protein